MTNTTVPSLKQQQSAEQTDCPGPWVCHPGLSQAMSLPAGGTGFCPDAGQSLLGLLPQSNSCSGLGLWFFGAGDIL